MFQREDWATPLLPQRRGELLFIDSAHLAEPVAQPARSSVALVAQRFAQLLRRNVAAVD